MIKIVTDSTCNLPVEYFNKHGIRFVPSFIFFGSEEFREGVNITHQEFYKKLSLAKEIPMTSPPTSVDFLKVYNELSKDCDKILSIHISSQLSNIYKFASIAADIFNSQKKEKSCEVKTYDTKLVDMGFGFVVQETVKALQEGKSLQEVERTMNNVIEKIKGYFYIDKLEFLIRGGRVGKLGGFFGTLLNVKPILTIESGQLAPKDKVMGREKAKETILKLMEQDVKYGTPIKVGVCDSGAKEDGDTFLQTIKGRFTCVESWRDNISTSVTVHAGLGALVVFFYPV